jgi:hypothetical protein
MDVKDINNLGVISGYPTTIIVYDNEIVYCYHGGPVNKQSNMYLAIILQLYQKYIDTLNFYLANSELRLCINKLI